ncbi:MAG: NAD(P)H-dependent oxidoreductase subunit E, partial [Sinomicrobium sp.]|nr:NAD(P)H-dependent oxidoreductase subunit E [Sinomicrobium sp.]
MPSTYQIQHRSQLLNALWFYQDRNGYIPDHAVADLARQLNVSRVEIEGVISFYHFFLRKPGGKHQIYLNNSILTKFAGFSKIREAFETATGARLGQVDPTGTFGFFETACIGLSDQEPAALIDLHPFVKLTPQKVHQIVQNLKAGLSVEAICDQPVTNIQYFPPDGRTVFFRPYQEGVALRRALVIGPEAVLEELKKAKLLGMGGAFFPVHLKWQSCREQNSIEKYIVCNADEGEPGTFKDRVLMQTIPGLLL